MRDRVPATDTADWGESSPSVLLVAQNELKAVTGCTNTGLVDGTTLQIPSEFYFPHRFLPALDHALYVSRLTITKRSAKSAPLRRHNSENVSKRKFVPNISKALNKNRPSENGGRFARPEAARPRTEIRSTRSYQNNVQRPMCQSSRPQFVHSYSIFETGIGCVSKPDKNAVELCETKEAVLPQTEATEFPETDSAVNPLNQCEAFVTDIKQLFKNPPVIMHDSAAGEDFTLGKF
ncbi:unnamed protein product [Trichobilharzia regenti]|nr:unnamed protein product [Trichobilharzia regenti]